MSDAALLFAIACGFTAGVGAMLFGAAVGSYRRPALWILAGTALWLFGGVLLDLVLSAAKAYFQTGSAGSPDSVAYAAARDVFRFETEFGISAVLMFLFVFPFYGFLSARIFPAINEQNICVVWLLFSYLCFVRGSGDAGLATRSAWLDLQWIYLAPGGLGLAAFALGFRPLVLRIALYGWQLGALTILCFSEWPVVVELFAASDPGTSAVGPRLLWIFFAAMASIVLLFYLWFALKYFFIIVSCVRRRGRELAAAFFQAKLSVRGAPAGCFAALVGLQIAAYAINAVYEWAPAAALIQATVALMPALSEGWPGPSKYENRNESKNVNEIKNKIEDRNRSAGESDFEEP